MITLDNEKYFPVCHHTDYGSGVSVVVFLEEKKTKGIYQCLFSKPVGS